MSTVEKQLLDFEASLAEDNQQLTDRERAVMREVIANALRMGNERYAKALTAATRLARSLLSELAPEEIPILWETIEPQDEDWLNLVELCGMSPDEAGVPLPKTAEDQTIAGAFFHSQSEQAAFTLGVAVGQQLMLHK
jgi:hypothetical protein